MVHPKAATIDMLNPDRAVQGSFTMVHRKDKKNCQKSVKRCQSCKRMFSDVDHVVVKIEGSRSFTNKDGKKVVYTGNVYIHYLRSCLVEFQHSFNFSQITEPQSTLKLLPAGSQMQLLQQGCVIEQ